MAAGASLKKRSGHASFFFVWCHGFDRVAVLVSANLTNNLALLTHT